MEGDPSRTSVLLRRWHAGEQEGLEGLLDRHLPWIEDYVRRRLGPLLRRKGETCDFVQDALIQILRYGPRFHVSSDVHFRALVTRILENAIRDNYDWYTAQRRDIARERPLPADSVLDLDPPRKSERSPSEVAVRREREAWIRLGIELLRPEDRRVLVLREWESLSFPEVAERLEISADAARKRFNRALGRLTDVVDELRRGNIPLRQ